LQRSSDLTGGGDGCRFLSDKPEIKCPQVALIGLHWLQADAKVTALPEFQHV
jgi:hypothetical protein